MRATLAGLLAAMICAAGCGDGETGPAPEGGLSSGGAAGAGGASNGGASNGGAANGGTAAGGATASGSATSTGGFAASGGAPPETGGASNAGGAGDAGPDAASTGGTNSGGTNSGGQSTEPGAPTSRFELEARDLTLSVDDDGSIGGDGAISTYAWTFGDGGTATERTPRLHVYAAPGTYQVTLRVSNASGKSASTSRSVTVSQRAPGDYAPDDATTGVPGVVKDRLYALNLEKSGKSSSNTPTAAEETLYITKSGDTWLLRRNMSTAVTLPAENAYMDGGRFVIDRVHLRGYIDVRAPDVTIRRSIVEAVSIPQAPVAAAPGGINVGRRLIRGNNAAATNLYLEDLEVRVPEAVQRGAAINASYHHGLGLEASRLTLLRSEITGTVDGMQVHQGGGTYTDTRIERSYIHDMQFYELDAERTDGDSTHSDGIQVECSLPQAGALYGVQLLGNVLDMTNDPNLNASLMITRNACATSGLMVRANFMDGAVFPINIGTGTTAEHVTVYANENRFGPNRAAGSKPDKTWTTSTTAKVMAVKSNTDGTSAYENHTAGGTQSYVYFSFDPPDTAGAQPPSGEANRNTMVDHARGAQLWGTVSRGAAGIGLY